jgi:hypothetical protein
MRLCLLFVFVAQVATAQISTQWGEQYPYNQFCPYYEGQQTYAGNKSVAVAQFLNYWGVPNIGYGEITYENIWTGTISCEFYQEYQPVLTEEQTGWLVFAAGASCQAQFSPYLQNSLCSVYNLDTIQQALKDYWGYKQGVITTDTSEINQYILTGRPVIVESYPIPPQLGCARFFLLDGYNGQYHVNNSFGGLNDGFYPINDIMFMGTHFGDCWRVLLTEPDSIDISGYVFYDGTNAKISGYVEFDSVTVIIDTGYFHTRLPSGSYLPLVVPSCSCNGKINALDALMIAKYYTELICLEGLRLEAADVNSDQGVNSLDALLDLRKFVGYPTQFSKNWCCERPFINTDTTVVIHCRCTGDIN